MISSVRPSAYVGLCALALLGTMSLTGCGHDDSSGSTSPPPSSTFSVYAVVNTGTGGTSPSSAIQQFTSNSSGTLTTSGSSLSLGSGTTSIGLAINTSHRLAAVATASASGSGFYQVLTLNPSGTVQPTGITFGSGDEGPDGVAFSPDGSHAYAILIKSTGGTATATTIQEFTVGSGGTMTATGSPITFATNVFAFGIVLSPDGTHAYAFLSDENTNKGILQEYTVGTGGVLTATGTPINQAANVSPFALTFSPDGKFAYGVLVDTSSTGTLSGTIQQYTVGSGGSLTATGTPIQAGANQGFFSLAFSPDGTRAYALAVNSTTNTGAIQQFSVGSGGTLTSTGVSLSFPTGTLVLGLGVL